jgi:SAM-dependent methyltransferase
MNIDQYKERYELFDYHIQAIGLFLREVSFSGKRILELGGSNIAKEFCLDILGAAEWVSVDLIGPAHYAMMQQKKHYASVSIYPLDQAKHLIGSEKYLIFDGAAEDIGTMFEDRFDLCISITAFEHMLSLPLVLRRAYKSLVNSGKLLSYFGPIWSGPHGHHCWVDAELNFNSGAVPNSTHLVARPLEMFLDLERRFGTLRANEAIKQIYHGDRINRLFYDDYINIFKASEFKSCDYAPYYSIELAPDIKKLLRNKYPYCSDFETYGLFASFKKEH